MSIEPKRFGVHSDGLKPCYDYEVVYAVILDSSMAEHRTVNATVLGSSPSRGACKARSEHSSWGELFAKVNERRAFTTKTLFYAQKASVERKRHTL